MDLDIHFLTDHPIVADAFTEQLGIRSSKIHTSDSRACPDSTFADRLVGIPMDCPLNIKWKEF